MSAETQRVCGFCRDPKRGHELPRAEGGHGGGTSGRCVVYGCGCPGFVPSEEFVEQEYTGSPLPKWVAEGVKVKVKRTASTKHGLDGTYGNNTVHAGEVGLIERVDGIGWWDWRVCFGRGRTVKLSDEVINDLARVRG